MPPTGKAFNGATAFQRWKPDDRQRNKSVDSEPFNGATAFQRWKPQASRWGDLFRWCLQWGHRLSAMETCGTPLAVAGPHQPFNGATAFQRWKHHQRHPQRGPALDPSMGPPPFSDGNLAQGQRIARSWPSFNGATAFQRWKLLARHPSVGDFPSFNGATAFQRWKPLFVARLRHGFMQKRAFPQESVTG